MAQCSPSLSAPHTNHVVQKVHDPVDGGGTAASRDQIEPWTLGASAARSLIEVARLSVYLPRNARALMRAWQLGGEIKYVSKGEIEARNHGYSAHSVETWRA